MFGSLDYEFIWKKNMEESYGLKVDRVEDLFGFVNWEDVLNRYFDVLERIDIEVCCKRLLKMMDLIRSFMNFLMLFLLCCIG